MTWIIELPLQLNLSKKTKFALNLNIYRNAHFYTLNKAKIFFQDLIAKKLKNIPKLNQIKITYTVFFGSKVKFDISNICSIVDKFFSDTLVNLNIIPDDNYTVITSVTYNYGGYDKNNPRIIATIEECSSQILKEKNMKIMLTKEEVSKIIKNFVKNAFYVLDEGDIDVSINNQSEAIIVFTPSNLKVAKADCDNNAENILTADSVVVSKRTYTRRSLNQETKLEVNENTLDILDSEEIEDSYNENELKQLQTQEDKEPEFPKPSLRKSLFEGFNNLSNASD